MIQTSHRCELYKSVVSFWLVLLDLMADVNDISSQQRIYFIGETY